MIVSWKIHNLLFTRLIFYTILFLSLRNCVAMSIAGYLFHLYNFIIIGARKMKHQKPIVQ